MDNNNYSITHLNLFPSLQHVYILYFSARFQVLNKGFFLADTHQKKPLIYQALPSVFDSIFEAAGHVVVASPLVNLMKDQVDKLANLGIFAASLNDISEEKARGVRAEMFK